MSLALLDVGAEKILQIYFGSEAHTIHLYVNDVIPDTTGIVYTEAPTGAPANYVSKSIATTAFTVSIQSSIAQAACAAQVFTFNGNLGATIYGYFVKSVSTSVIVFAVRLPTPYAPTLDGDILSVTPIFQLSNGVPA